MIYKVNHGWADKLPRVFRDRPCRRNASTGYLQIGRCSVMNSGYPVIKIFQGDGKQQAQTAEYHQAPADVSQQVLVDPMDVE